MKDTSLTVLSSASYPSKNSNHGDSIMIDTGKALITYDCGCEDHARRVEEYMRTAGYSSTVVVLSHNDSDHFNGIPYLVEQGLVSDVYCHLFLKHKQEVLDLLNDNRVTNRSVGERIKQVYKNIASLSKTVTLKDALDTVEIVPGVTVVGPETDYALETIKKALQGSESSKIDAETVINAASVQVAVDFPDGRCLLCGDASFEAIADKLDDYSVIQLPHHGKPDTAEKIFQAVYKSGDVLYLVSDNTGNTNGGSDGLKTYGRRICTTRNGDIHYPLSVSSAQASKFARRTLGQAG